MENSKVTKYNNNKKKEKVKSKLWLCFRSPSGDGSFEPELNSTDRENEPVSVFSMDLTPLKYGDFVGIQDKKKSGGHGRFSRTLKSVLSGKVLNKKIETYGRRKCEEKDSNETKREEGEYLISRNDEIQSESSKLEDGRKTDAEAPSFASSSRNSSSAITPTSLCSTCSSSMRETNSNPLRLSRIDTVDNSIRQYSRNRESGGGADGGGCVSSRGIWCLLVISMFGLAVWGKVCGIICALMWSLLFVPCRNSTGYSSEGEKISNKKVEREENGSNNTSFDSDKYKKKVIMEGLLARDRSHARGR